jgi:hypothetical protein
MTAQEQANLAVTVALVAIAEAFVEAGVEEWEFDVEVEVG